MTYLLTKYLLPISYYLPVIEESKAWRGFQRRAYGVNGESERSIRVVISAGPGPTSCPSTCRPRGLTAPGVTS